MFTPEHFLHTTSNSTIYVTLNNFELSYRQHAATLNSRLSTKAKTTVREFAARATLPLSTGQL
jgi:hypothetical protein